MAGTVVVDTIKSSTTSAPTFQNTSGTQIGTLCVAWVNFNGTTATPSTIRGQFNVSSITKNGGGDYYVNFTNALPDANYAILATGSDNTDASPASVGIYDSQQAGTDPSTTRYRLAQVGGYSSAIVCTACFR